MYINTKEIRMSLSQTTEVENPKENTLFNLGKSQK